MKISFAELLDSAIDYFEESTEFLDKHGVSCSEEESIDLIFEKAKNTIVIEKKPERVTKGFTEINISQNHDKQPCINCGSDDFNYDEKRGELTCRKCSVVNGTILVSQPERELKDKKTRSHNAPMLKIKGQRNTVFYPKDAPEKKAHFEILARIENKSLTPAARTYINFMQQIERICSSISATKEVKDLAFSICTKARQKFTLRGKNIDEVVASAVYVASRCLKTTRTADEILEKSGVSKSALFKNTEFLRKSVIPDLNLKFSPISVPDFLYSQLGSRFNNSSQYCVNIYLDLFKDKSTKAYFSGRSQKAIASAIAYEWLRYSGNYRTQHELAGLFGITEVVLRYTADDLFSKCRLEKILDAVELISAEDELVPVPEKQLLDVFNDGLKTLHGISESLGVNTASAYNAIISLLKSGKIVKIRSADRRSSDYIRFGVKGMEHCSVKTSSEPAVKLIEKKEAIQSKPEKSLESLLGKPLTLTRAVQEKAMSYLREQGMLTINEIIRQMKKENIKTSQMEKSFEVFVTYSLNCLFKKGVVGKRRIRLLNSREAYFIRGADVNEVPPLYKREIYACFDQNLPRYSVNCRNVFNNLCESEEHKTKFFNLSPKQAASAISYELLKHTGKFGIEKTAQLFSVTPIETSRASRAFRGNQYFEEVVNKEAECI